MYCILANSFMVFLLMVGTAQSSCLCAFRLPELQVFYDAMSGPLWKSRWDFSDPNAPCTFVGVDCDIGSADITMIVLSRQGLNGQLPAMIANLTKLTLFNVSYNAIHGTLPPEFAAWTSIAQVILEINNITGTLPPHYSEWGRSIRRFYCGRNNISGILPVSYSNWSMIETFDGSYNQLNGSLPSEFAKWSSISVFVLTSNLISSTLPSEYAAWIRLVDFFGDSNKIIGTLPPEYSAWAIMQLFHCAKNSISGTLPKSYRSWPLIKEFDVQYNQLSGSLPPEFADWRPSLFTLNNNQISSTLPPQYSQWGVSTQYFYLQDCDIYGSLPPSYSNWTYLMGFAIRNSRVSGTLPNEYASWVRIGTFVISYSSLSGTIPSTYNHWSSVTTIDLSNNHLTGTIPSNIWGSMALLTTVALSNNSLSGTLPAQLLRVPQLGYISVGFNQLTGTIPPIASSQLVFLVFQNNSMMKGSVPTQVSLMMFRLMSICGTSLQCPTGGFFQLYCFPREMLYELTDPVIAVIAPFTTTCTMLPPQPPKVLDRSTTVTREVDAPGTTSWTTATAAFAPSSASVATSGVTVTIAIASSILGTSTSALSGGTRGIQTALMTRRKRALCQLSATRSMDDNGGPSDAHHSAISNSSPIDINADPSLLCCDAITSPTQLESIASLSPLIGALLGNTALVLILCLIKYSLPFAVRYWCSPSSAKTARHGSTESLVKALHAIAGEPIGPVSAMWSPYTTLLAPTVATAFGAALLPCASAGIQVVGAMGVCLWAAPWVVCAYALWWRCRCSSFPFMTAAVRGQRSRSLRTRLLEPSTNLVVAPPSADAHARQLLKDYGPVFEGYTASRYWYFNVELCLGFVNGFMMGAGYNEAVRNPCSVWVEWCLVVLGLLEVLLGVVILRPFSVPLDALGLLMTVGLTTLSQLIPLLDSSDGASNAADAIGLAASITQLALLLCNVVALVSSATPWRCVRLREHSKTMEMCADDIAPLYRQRIMEKNTKDRSRVLKRVRLLKTVKQSQVSSGYQNLLQLIRVICLLRQEASQE